MKKKKLILAFGTFDILHPGHVSFLKQAKKLGHTLTVSVARDSIAKKAKGNKPMLNEDSRLKLVESLKFVDAAVLGDAGAKQGAIRHIKRIKPDIIALGYDQHPYIAETMEAAEGMLRRLGLTTKFRRLKPFKPSRYKSSILKLKASKSTIRK